MEKVEQAVKRVDEFIAQYPQVTQFEKFKELEEKTGYSKVYFFLGAVLLLCGTIWTIGGFKLITDLVGILYPAYMSFQSMESSTGVADSSTLWLTYWVIFSFLNVLENVFPFLPTWIPMYYYNKAGLIVWLYHPQTNGAEVVYNQGVRNHILPHLEGTKPSSKKD